MPITRTRKSKENPHYGFLVSWEPKDSKNEAVKRETKREPKSAPALLRQKKNADSLAQAEPNNLVKKGILRSLFIISLVLILELVIYLAWNKFLMK